MGIAPDEYEKLRPMASLSYDGGELRYFVPNQVVLWRVDTLLTKEPATINWLNRMSPESILLDVGANVGMYTIYAAQLMGATVFAFEPESQNFALLAKNIQLNNLGGRVRAFGIALSDCTKLDFLYLSKFLWDGGESCHSVSAEVGFDLKPRPSPFAQGCMTYTIDQAIADGAISVPDFIKIDVDGFEHKVIEGAWKTLQDPRVKSMCIEINPHLEEHRALLKRLGGLGFHYDPVQVQKVARQQGPFAGCAEYIFDRFRTEAVVVEHGPLRCAAAVPKDDEHGRALEHVLARIEAAPVATEPFPHVLIDGIFPPDYYEKIQACFPAAGQMVPLGETGRVSKGAYQERLVTLFEDEYFSRLDARQLEFWGGFSTWLYSERFIKAVIGKFLPWCANRLGSVRDRRKVARVRSDALIVSDRTDYAIGPHTDATHRLISFLFYLPRDDRSRSLGTSFYRSKDPLFVCPGGPHYPFEGFTRQETVEFLPNRLLMFVRTGKSFHGVESIELPDADRRLVINNVRLIDG